jgi:hypothetical protein
MRFARKFFEPLVIFVASLLLSGCDQVKERLTIDLGLMSKAQALAPNEAPKKVLENTDEKSAPAEAQRTESVEKPEVISTPNSLKAKPASQAALNSQITKSERPVIKPVPKTTKAEQIREKPAEKAATPSLVNGVRVYIED